MFDVIRFIHPDMHVAVRPQAIYSRMCRYRNTSCNQPPDSEEYVPTVIVEMFCGDVVHKAIAQYETEEQARSFYDRTNPTSGLNTVTYDMSECLAFSVIPEYLTDSQEDVNEQVATGPSPLYVDRWHNPES